MIGSKTRHLNIKISDMFNGWNNFTLDQNQFIWNGMFFICYDKTLSDKYTFNNNYCTSALLLG